MSDSRELTLTWSRPQPDVLCVAVTGVLDYDTADMLTAAADGRLRDTAPREFRLDCAGLRFCDSYGLSSLLMLRRRTDAAGVVLRLDGRGPALERLLRTTRTLEYLTGGAAGVREEQLDT